MSDTSQHEEPKVVVRDRRKIDPTTGTPREPTETAAPAAASTGGGRHAKPEEPASGGVGSGSAGATTEEVAALRSQLAERTADLQRVTAEYANYRKRVDRDRAAVVETATGEALSALLPVLDDIDRARLHGDLTGAFKAVADKFEAALEKLGLARFGETGDPFDPMMHQAMTHGTSPDVTEPSCVQVFQPGYRFGERLLRAALVAVAEPEATPASARSGPEPTGGRVDAAPDGDSGAAGATGPSPGDPADGDSAPDSGGPTLSTD